MRRDQPSREWPFIRRALTNSNPYRSREREKEKERESERERARERERERGAFFVIMRFVKVNSHQKKYTTVLVVRYRVIRWKVSRDADINWIGHEWNLVYKEGLESADGATRTTEGARYSIAFDRGRCSSYCSIALSFLSAEIVTNVYDSVSRLRRSGGGSPTSHSSMRVRVFRPSHSALRWRQPGTRIYKIV